MPSRNRTTIRLRPTIIGPRTTSSSPSRPSKRRWPRPFASRPRRPPSCSRATWSVPRPRPKSRVPPMSRSRRWAWAGLPNPAGRWTSAARTPPRSKRPSRPRPWPWSGKRATNCRLPKTESPAPAAMPEAPKEPPKTPEPAAVQAEKIDWASVAKKAATPNNEPLRRRTRWRGLKSSPANRCPRRTSSPGFPRRPRRKLPTPQSGPEAADRITQQGSTLERSNRDGAPLPSTVIPDAGTAGPISRRCRQFPAESVGGRFDRPGGEVGYFAGPARSHDRLGRQPGFRPRIDALALAAGRDRRSRQGPAFDRRRLARGSCGTARRRPRIGSQQRSALAVGAGPAGDRLANGRRRFRPQCRPGGQVAADPVRDGIESSRRGENRRKRHAFRGRRGRVQSRRTDQYARCRPADCHATHPRAAACSATTPARLLRARYGDVLPGNDHDRPRQRDGGHGPGPGGPRRIEQGTARGRRQRRRRHSACPVGGCRSASRRRLPWDPLPVRPT